MKLLGIIKGHANKQSKLKRLHVGDSYNDALLNNAATDVGDIIAC